MPRRARASGSEVLIHITAEERDLLLSHVAPPDALDEVLGSYHRHGPLVPLYLTGQQADTFLQLVEEIANSARNQVAQRRLGVLFERLEDGFADKVDPGAHLVRPAACRAGYTPRQGQYLAFIYHYQALHRRAPAEADLNLPRFGGHLSCLDYRSGPEVGHGEEASSL